MLFGVVLFGVVVVVDVADVDEPGEEVCSSVVDSRVRTTTSGSVVGGA